MQVSRGANASAMSEVGVDNPNAHSAPPNGAIDRLERTATLLLAASALAVVALIGWGGLVLDLTPLAAIFAALLHAATGEPPVQPTIGDAILRLRWEDLAPLAGTVVTLLFWWHAVSLVAEVMLCWRPALVGCGTEAYGRSG